MTPGAPSPGGYNPHTPGSNIDQASNDWVTTDIMVRVKDTFLDVGVINQTGIIRSVTVSKVLNLVHFDFYQILLATRYFMTASRNMQIHNPHVSTCRF